MEGEGEGEMPPPYTFDAGGPVAVVVVEDSRGGEEQTRASLESLAPVYFQGS